MDNRFCPHCGTELSDAAERCTLCGQLLSTERVVVRKHKGCRADGGIVRHCLAWLKTHNLPFLIKSALLVVLSTLLLVFAFLPIFEVKASLNSVGLDEEFSFQISAVDTVVFFADSLQKLDQDDIVNSDLMEDIEVLTKKLTADLAKTVDPNATTVEFTPKQKAMIEDLLYSTVRLMLQSEEVETSFFMIFAMVSSLLYLALTVALLVCSVLNIVFAIWKKRSFFRLSVQLLCAAPVLLLTSYFCISPYATSTAMTDAGSLTGIAVWSVVLVFAFVLFLLISRWVAAKRIPVASLVKNTLALALSFVVICVSFLPVMQTDITRVFAGNTTEKTATASIPVTYYAYLDLNEAALEEIDVFEMDDFTLAIDGFAAYSLRQVERGEADSENFLLLTGVVGACIKADYIPIFSLGFVFAVLLLLSAGIVMMQSLVYLATGEKLRWLSLTAKIVCVASAVLVLALSIAYSLVAMDILQAWEGATDRYSVSIAAGAIVPLIFAVLALLVPTRDVRVIHRYADDEAPATEEKGAPTSETSDALAPATAPVAAE